MQIGADGYLHAINPEAGFFGVAPGTGMRTNPNVMGALNRNTIFTNVGVTADDEPWWEGIGGDPPAGLVSWLGEKWDKSKGPAAHPNSRYTVPAVQSPSISSQFEAPAGVPISAFIFGGRRARLAPLVHESFDWQHGVFVGATMASETTAAITGAVGVTRRDPMAMLPFCGYNMGDYFRHWLEMGASVAKPPKIFRVNWFRTDESGRFLWPGFGDNLRVLKWILDRSDGRGNALDTAIGEVPTHDSIDRSGIKVSDADMTELLKVDPAEWVEAVATQEELIQMFGNRMPKELIAEHDELARRINAAITPPDLVGRDSGT
jgi:phosphoenolpyruvate carboxykinase (GTP)